jgi:hypothetical protein
MLLPLEVLNKFASPALYWIVAAVVGAAGFLMSRRWPMMIILFLLWSAFLLWGIIDTYREPFVGESAWKEGGWLFLFHMAGSAMVMFILPLIGAILGGRQPMAETSVKGAV